MKSIGVIQVMIKDNHKRNNDVELYGLSQSNLNLIDDYLATNSMVSNRSDKIVISKFKNKFNDEVDRSTVIHSQRNEAPKKKPGPLQKQKELDDSLA